MEELASPYKWQGKKNEIEQSSRLDNDNGMERMPWLVGMWWGIRVKEA